MNDVRCRSNTAQRSVAERDDRQPGYARPDRYGPDWSNTRTVNDAQSTHPYTEGVVKGRARQLRGVP